MNEKKTPRVAVLGSINMDLVIRCAKLARPGETVLANSSEEVPGGKGANQAVGAARLGATVTMIGRVGSDAFALTLVQNLEREGIATATVSRTANCPSGLAIVAVEDSGENSILVVPGANGRVDTADVRNVETVLKNADVLLLQLEVPLPTVLFAIETGKRLGCRVIVNPAPAPPTLQPAIMASIMASIMAADLICPNRSEASAILGHSIDSIDAAKLGVRELIDRGASSAVITLGADGAVFADGQNVEWVPPFAIQPVDTTAAGDAFVAALAVRWSEGRSLGEAVRFGCAAGALAATKRGAQPGMPFRHEVERMFG